jgi:hypothetical protein
MTDWIALTEFHGLLDLMLGGEQNGPTFTLDGVRCSFGPILGRHACFEAVSPDFGLMVICAGWYGDYSTTPIHLLIVGDHIACMQWLPMKRTDKCAIIEHLPVDEHDKTILRLAV